MNLYYKELDFIDAFARYRKYLTNLCYKYENLSSSYTPNGWYYGKEYKSYHFKNDNNAIFDYSFFEEILPHFLHIETHNTVEKLFNTSQVSVVSRKLHPHIDLRKCVVTFPIIIKDPIEWYKDNDIICSYEYSKDYPVLINTSIPHGSINNTHKRILFQIGGFVDSYDFLTVSNLIQ